MNDTNEVENKSHETNDSKGAAVKFPPPLIFLIAVIAGFFLDFIRPIGLIDSVVGEYLGLFLFATALLVVIVLGLKFRREKTSIEPWKPTTKIMSSGLYAYSRNPIYAAFCLIVIGLGLLLNSFWILVSFIPAAFTVFYIAIAKEEKYLENKFGAEYIEYKNKVRRWL